MEHVVATGNYKYSCLIDTDAAPCNEDWGLCNSNPFMPRTLLTRIGVCVIPIHLWQHSGNMFIEWSQIIMVHYSTYTFIMIFNFDVSTSLTFKLLGEHLAAQFVGNGSLRASKAYIQPSGAYHFVPLTSMAYILYLYMFCYTYYNIWWLLWSICIYIYTYMCAYISIFTKCLQMFVYMCDIWTSTNDFVGTKPVCPRHEKKRAY